MIDPSNKQPFCFSPSPETLKLLQNTTAEERLQWLEEANQFVRDFVSPDKIERWQRYLQQQESLRKSEQHLRGRIMPIKLTIFSDYI